MVNTMRHQLNMDLPKAMITTVVDHDSNPAASSVVNNNMIRFENGELCGTVELCHAGNR